MDSFQLKALQAVQQLNIYRRKGERAPHKPLLLLLALADAQKHSERLHDFADICRRLERLLVNFGTQRKQFHPEYPFWRLERALWQVIPRTGVRMRKGHSDPPRSELIRVGARGGLVEKLWDEIHRDSGFASRIGAVVLHTYFPGAVHEDLLKAVGLTIPTAWTWPASMPPEVMGTRAAHAGA